MATTKKDATDLGKARAELAGAESALEDARNDVAAAEVDASQAGPEHVLTARTRLANAQKVLGDREALVTAWRTQCGTLETAEKRARLAAVLQESEAGSFREAHLAGAALLVPLAKQVRELLDAAQLRTARQNALATEAERLAKEIGESISVERIAPDHFAAVSAVQGFLADAKSIQVAIPRSKKDLVLRVLSATGHIGSEFDVHALLETAKAAGLGEDAVIAAALDGSLAGVLREARAAKQQADEAKRIARVEAATAYQEAWDHFPKDSPKTATAAQRAALDAELAHLGEAAARELRKRRGHSGEPVSEAAE